MELLNGTMVKVKRVYEPASPEDGKRILVERLWPRGISKESLVLDEWLREVAPSTGLRKWFAHDPARYDEFRRRYLRELEGKPEIIDRLRAEAREGTITLLFSARDARHNNALVLQELLGAP